MADHTTKSNQKGNQVTGDQAGRDVIKPIYNIGSSSSGSISQLNSLYKKLEVERSVDVAFDEIIEELQHYKAYAKNSEVIGLDAKLEKGNRSAFLAFAMDVKERFSKKLLRNEHSETAQEIFALLLGKVYSSFQINIVPKIKEGHPDEFVNALIQEHIIRPLEEILGENLLRIFEPEIHGMVYFLTGNCHLNWD